MNTEHGKPLLIRASAGTGKTYQLTGRLLGLLLQGVPVESLLATTFTRKAAGEILSRVLLVLGEAAIDPTDQALQRLRQQTGLAAVSRDDCVQLVNRLLRDIHRLKILTLDSLFSQLARTFGFELGLPPGWRLADEVEDVWIRERAVDGMLADSEPRQLLALLAMLGKGDTKRSVRREILNVVNDGYAEARACAVEAWDRLHVPEAPERQRVAEAANQLLGNPLNHKSAARALDKMAELMERGDWGALAGQTLVAAVHTAPPDEPATYYGREVSGPVLEAIELVIEACTSHVRGLLREQTTATGAVIADYERQLMGLKQSIRAYAFDDIAHRLATLFSRVSAGDTGHRLDGQIQHVLLDEFQDTSPAQWAVLKPLSLAAVQPAQGPCGSFFCVGDTKQAIYGWRGGVAGIFDAVAEQVPGVSQREQNTSYRSSPVITDVVNRIFSNLNRHPAYPAGARPEQTPHDRAAYESLAVERFARGFPRHEAAQGQLPGYVRFASTAAASGESETSAAGQRDDSQTRNKRHFDDVARTIDQLAAQAPGSSIGVLTRTNPSVAWLIHLLRQRGVDVSQEGGNPLTDSPAVDLVLSTLMLAEHPGDGRWYFHVAHSPLAPWLRIESGDQREAIESGDQRGGAAGRIRRLVERVGVARAVAQIADQLAPHCSAADGLRLRQLVTLAHGYQQIRQPRLSDFVRLVRVKRVEKPQPAQVRVMTVHQSKGLEFDLVVLPELRVDLIRQSRQTIPMRAAIDAVPDGMLRYLGTDQWHYLPSAWQRAFGQHADGLMTESLCLLYVAITRARQALHLLTPPAAKADFKTKTADSLLFHALGCGERVDPTLGDQSWFESGDADWYQRSLPDRPS